MQVERQTKIISRERFNLFFILTANITFITDCILGFLNCSVIVQIGQITLFLKIIFLYSATCSIPIQEEVFLF